MEKISVGSMPPPMPPKPDPWSPSQSICPESYICFFLGSERQPQASATSLNLREVSSCSASLLLRFRSGWYLRARALQAFLISWSEAFLSTYRILQQSFFLDSFSFFLASLILSLRFTLGSSSWILLQSMMAAVYSPRSMLRSALLMRDLSQLGLSSSDLLRSSSALKVSLRFMKVSALLEQMMAFSFLLEGSRLMASVYFCSASSNLPLLISSFPSSFSCSHRLAVFSASLHFLWSGSSRMPSAKNFLARELSPPQSSMMPLRYQKSGDCCSRPMRVLLSRVSASVVSPVLARHSTLNSLSRSFCGILWTRWLMQESPSVKSPRSTAPRYLSQLDCRLSASSSSFLMATSFSYQRAVLNAATASPKRRICWQARPFLRSALVKLGLRARQFSQSEMHLRYSAVLEQALALLEQQVWSLGLSLMASEQQKMAFSQFLAVKALLPSFFQSSPDFSTSILQYPSINLHPFMFSPTLEYSKTIPTAALTNQTPFPHLRPFPSFLTQIRPIYVQTHSAAANRHFDPIAKLNQSII